MRRTRPMKATHETLHTLADAFRPAVHEVYADEEPSGFKRESRVRTSNRKRGKAGQWARKFGG